MSRRLEMRIYMCMYIFFFIYIYISKFIHITRGMYYYMRDFRNLLANGLSAICSLACGMNVLLKGSASH